jgi:uncharacterized protein
MSAVLSHRLLSVILSQYRLPWNAAHGVGHWARVVENGRAVAPRTGASLEVVELFAVLHDACRRNEGIDPGHGLRGAHLARSLRDLLPIDNLAFELLFEACARHTDGLLEGDPTVQTCWDADRLDLYRVRIYPNPEYLCTPAARDPALVTWAVERSQAGGIPAWAERDWGIPPRPSADDSS